MKWYAKAPSNLALIKYMGKTDESSNIPTNSSLSYTLDKLQSFVEIEDSILEDDVWVPLDDELVIQLSVKDQLRFINHCKYIKNIYKLNQNFIIRSNNNFPQNVGLASSASSFAALTKGVVAAITCLKKIPIPNNVELALLSKHGSGSSCRSFFRPWALWSTKTVNAIDIPYNNLQHKVIVISKEHKKISSSMAHKLVWSSRFFEKRLLIIEDRLQTLIEILREQNWIEAFKIIWQEFIDMHFLFETAKEPFSYITNVSKKILDDLKLYFEEHKDGPLVTMDAGPNIHLLFRDDQGKMLQEICSYYSQNYEII